MEVIKLLSRVWRRRGGVFLNCSTFCTLTPHSGQFVCILYADTIVNCYSVPSLHTVTHSQGQTSLPAPSAGRVV